MTNLTLRRLDSILASDDLHFRTFQRVPDVNDFKVPFLTQYEILLRVPAQYWYVEIALRYDAENTSTSSLLTSINENWRVNAEIGARAIAIEQSDRPTAFQSIVESGEKPFKSQVSVHTPTH